MKDYLQDIVKNTYTLGVIELVKIIGTEKDTLLYAVSVDNTVVIKARFHNTVPDFIGTFGMPNLNKLNTILNIPEYKDDANIGVVNKMVEQQSVPSYIQFSNKLSDFKNEYRLMTQATIDERIKTPKFKGAQWHVEFEPTVAGIQRLKFQASANSEETTFYIKQENNDIKMYFGDHSTHAGNFVFQSDVSGKLTKQTSYPVAIVIAILNLPGDKTMKISDNGVMMITVDSGLGLYEYIIPAQTK
jgi:hypothetical protein